MEEDRSPPLARELMLRFAGETGLIGSRPPRRYLWTDAFAVCNFLELFSRTGEERWRELAALLVGQVHEVLGKHRQDDARSGWISGLGEEEGRNRPTAGGLRIGKALNERAPGEPFDERLEWERDGQYYHYLTKWMHALGGFARVSGDPAVLAVGDRAGEEGARRLRRRGPRRRPEAAGVEDEHRPAAATPAGHGPA